MLQIFAFLPVLILNLGPGTADAAFLYGQHYPQGLGAVNYIYGPEGMWKEMRPISYIWNYYEHHATPEHPYDKGALIGAANGSAFFTARDANGYLLCDNDHDLEIDLELGPNCGYAFHEHAGKGVNGSGSGGGFTNFWLDDNWLARHLSIAYGRLEPNGLSDQDGFMRWKIISGDTTNWILYNSHHFDTLALDGLFYISSGYIASAKENWRISLEKTGAYYDTTARQYNYPGFEENYHMGLFKILTDQLLTLGALPSTEFIEALQHSISLRAHILANQEHDAAGRPLGWTSNLPAGSSLINSESISCNVLALGAGAKFVLEVEENLPQPRMNYSSQTVELPPGNFVAQFHFRAQNLVDGTLAILQVQDLTTGEILRTQEVSRSHFYGADLWSIVPVLFMIQSEGHVLQFHVLAADNGENVDFSIVKIID